MSSLRIMSFNIRGAFFEDGVNHWSNRAGLNIRTILNHAPDLIGFQELHQKNLEDYQGHLTGYHFELGPPYNNREPFQYPAIAWNAAKLRLIDKGGFWLSETPDMHSGSWDTACIRSAAWVRLEWSEHGLTFLHLNTHLDHISEEARLEGSRLILNHLEELRSPHVPQIVTGDFNCLPTSDSYRLFREHGYQDAYLVAGHRGPIITFHGFQGNEFSKLLPDLDRIDFILLRNWESIASVSDCYLGEDSDPPVYPSDHYPVIADLKL